MSEYKKTLLDEARYKLSATRMKGEEKGQAKLSFSYRFNKLQLSVWPGFKGDKGLYMEITPSTFMAWLDALALAAEKADFKDIKFTLMKGRGGKEVAGELIVARDNDGVVWTCATAEGFPKIQFKLLYPDNTRVSYLDGTPLSKQEQSKIRTISYSKSILTAVNHVMQNGFDPNAGAEFNRSGGGSKKSGGGYDGSSGFDDEIPDGF